MLPEELIKICEDDDVEGFQYYKENHPDLLVHKCSTNTVMYIAIRFGSIGIVRENIENIQTTCKQCKTSHELASEWNQDEIFKMIYDPKHIPKVCWNLELLDYIVDRDGMNAINVNLDCFHTTSFTNWLNKRLGVNIFISANDRFIGDVDTFMGRCNDVIYKSRFINKDATLEQLDELLTHDIEYIWKKLILKRKRNMKKHIKRAE